MAVLAASVSKRGQVTIPVEIRKALRLKAGDRVVFQIHGQEVRICPAPSRLLAGFGAVEPKERPEDFKRVRRETEEWVVGEALKELENGL